MTENVKTIGDRIVKIIDEKKMGFADAAALLNKEKVRTSNGKRWLPQTVGRVYQSTKGNFRKARASKAGKASGVVRGTSTAIAARMPVRRDVKRATKALTNGSGMAKLGKMVADFFGKMSALGVDVSRIEKRDGKIDVVYTSQEEKSLVLDV